MCYSAQVRADYKKFVRALGATATLIAYGAITQANANTLVIDWPGSFFSATGADLTVVNTGISMYNVSYGEEPTDVLSRSGFDAVPWSWQLFLESGMLAEGEGYCLMESDVPDVRLRCDGL